MRKIIITSENQIMNFSYIYIDPSIINVITENNNKELVFSEDYIKNNYTLFTNFINEFVNTFYITKISIDTLELFNMVMKIIKPIKKIDTFILTNEELLSDEDIKKISKISHLKEINCFNMESKNIKFLVNCKKKVKLNYETLADSEIADINDLNNYSNIYYKEDMKVIHNLKENDLNDFEKFCKVNEKLKNVYLYGFNTKTMDQILEKVQFNYLKKIKIQLYVDNSNVKAFQKSIKGIKKLKRKYRKNKNISFEIKYSEEYIQNNIMKQLSIMVLKFCGIAGIVFVASISCLMLKDNFQTNKDIDKVQKYEIEELTLEPEENVAQSAPIEIKDKIPPLQENYEELLKINKDTIGWLKVNNTNVNYPVVQTDNNNYYLDYSFYKKRNYNGWIFLDYRNNYQHFDDNNIIYGHNGTMFGSLYKTIKSYWYQNTDNHIITFNTLYSNNKFKIFAIYETDLNFYYIQPNYDNENDFNEFISTVKQKSVYNFQQNIYYGDKVLTLSTCTQHGTKRLVVQAVLIK